MNRLSMFHGRFSAESEAGFYKLISRVPDGKITNARIISAKRDQPPRLPPCRSHRAGWRGTERILLITVDAEMRF